MNKSILTFLCIILCAASLSAQKKPLTHDVYDSWKTVRNEKISDDGKTALYEIKPQVGDGVLVVHDLAKNQKQEFARGGAASFFDNGQWVMFGIDAKYEDTRKAKIDKVAKDKMPKASIGLLNLKSRKYLEYKDIEKAAAAAEAPVVAFIVKEKEDTTAKSKMKDVMLAIDASTGDTLTRVEYVKNFDVSRSGDIVYAVKMKTTETLWVWQQGETTRIQDAAKDGIDKIVLDRENGKRFAYSTMADTVNKRYDLYDVSFENLLPRRIDFSDSGLTFSNADAVSYSKHGGLLHFSIAEPPVKQPKDTVPADEKFVLDVWSYTDTLLQTQQFVQEKQMKRNSYKVVYDLKNDKGHRLTRSYFETAYVNPERDDADIYLIMDAAPYTWSYTWAAFPREKDVYAFYPDSDSRELILKGQRDAFTQSPSGKWLVYYDMADSTWHSMDMVGKKGFELTRGLGVNFYKEDHDYPGEPASYGLGGWVEIDNGKEKLEYVILYDRYDIWLADPMRFRSAPRKLTNGREDGRTFRIVKTDSDAEYVNKSGTILLSSFDNGNKHGGYYSLTAGRNGNITSGAKRLVEGPYKYKFKTKAKKADKMLWTRESFNEFPDLHASGIRLDRQIRLSDANPQMKDYLWGSAGLTKWTDPRGNEVEGLLYLPENYDPNRRYPTIVYFYERSSDELFNHHYPQPSWSIIIPTMFTSNDYVVFIPNINFRVGHPGESSLEAVTSGSKALIERGIADPARIGLQGQSWAGYQINHIVTRTDMFRCASAGAGVSDMVSGYATTRGDSGIARMVQYEAGQSRIGATLWDAPELYIENSPVFHLPNVNTPLLLRHNDNDEAVPFSQGVIMFNGLRRLGKQVWMLNYHGHFHNMRARAPRMDWSIRMTQFFDHYLKDAPAPRWMTEGVTIRERGKDMKLELTK